MNAVDSADSELDVPDKLALCQEIIGYRFRDLELLRSALTHASGASSRVASNERLEFLGDAILGMVVCEQLYHRFPHYLEGELTKIKSVVVSRRVCGKISLQLGLEQCLIVGKGMSGSVGVPRSLLSDVFEALLAAVYLDGGMASARELVLSLMETELALAASGQLGGNHKSLLQQVAQREHGCPPQYQLVAERGPDHHKQFQMLVAIGDRIFTAAWGRNKKEAQQRAAGNALAELRGEEPPFR
jgi:ribonuclease-3